MKRPASRPNTQRGSQGPTKHVLWGWLSACLAGVLGACLLADPVPESPEVAADRPSIVGGGVAPSTAAPLRELPGEFVVPVQLGDPTVRHAWRVFVDLEPLPNRFAPDLFGFTEAGTNAPNLQSVHFTLTTPARDQCHRIEFVIGNGDAFQDSVRGTPSQTDTISWLYVPEGRTACSPYDGGGDDGAFPDRIDP